MKSQSRKTGTKGTTSGIPITYVPARNTIFLSYALAWCEVLGAADIFIGANAVDYSGYPDCRPAFIAAFEELANVATKAGVEGTRFHIHAPLLSMSKAADHRERNGTRRRFFADAQLLRSDRRTCSPAANAIRAGSGWKVSARLGCRIRFPTRTNEAVLRDVCSHARRTARRHFRRARAPCLDLAQASTGSEARDSHVCQFSVARRAVMLQTQGAAI